FKRRMKSPGKRTKKWLILADPSDFAASRCHRLSRLFAKRQDESLHAMKIGRKSVNAFGLQLVQATSTSHFRKHTSYVHTSALESRQVLGNTLNLFVCGCERLVAETPTHGFSRRRTGFSK